MPGETLTPFALTRYYQSIKQKPIQITPESDVATILHDAAIQHFKVYPFHTLHFNLKGKTLPIDLGRNALIHQLLEDQGGSCYHHNAVFQAILEENGLKSWFISCLVHDPMSPEKTFDIPTHIAIIFEHAEKSYLFDPGWDGSTLSIYPLPDDTPGAVVREGKYQIKRSDNAAYPFSFEEIKSDESSVVRYDFSTAPTVLADYKAALLYLNAETYAFHTLFLFSGISLDNHIIRLVNRQLMVHTIDGAECVNRKLPESVSLLDIISELLSAEKGLLDHLTVDDFKNPDGLGRLICAEPQATSSLSLSAAASMEYA